MSSFVTVSLRAAQRGHDTGNIGAPIEADEQRFGGGTGLDGFEQGVGAGGLLEELAFMTLFG